MLAGVDFWLGSREIVIAANGRTSQLLAMVTEVQTRYLPTKVLALVDGDGPGPALAKLAEGKASIKGMPTAYVCESFACKAPVTDIAAFKSQLDAAAGAAG